MLTVLLLTAALRATHLPASPTVGDPVVVRFQIAVDERVVLERSNDYEIVSSSRDGVVLRTFKPQSLMLEGRIVGPRGVVLFRRMLLPVRSVLRKGDDGKPAPLTPPVPVPATRTVWWSLSIATLTALAAWAVLYRISRKVRKTAEEPALTPEDELSAALAAIGPQSRLRWAILADATRRYLSRVSPQTLGSELTTRELLARLPSVSDSPDWQALVRRIVVEGDLDKFSPWGAAADIGPLLTGTMEVLPRPFRVVEEVAA